MRISKIYGAAVKKKSFFPFSPLAKNERMRIINKRNKVVYNI